MKTKYFFSIAILACCILFLSAGCQQQAEIADQPQISLAEQKPVAKTTEPEVEKPEPKPQGPPPKIEFESTVYQFGDVAPGSTNICYFNFKNIGAGDLKIKKVTKRCGCTPFTLAKKLYKPGESGTLKVKYAAQRKTGKASKRLTMYTNDPSKPKVRLTVKANIVKAIDFEPKQLNLSLENDQASIPPITITSIDNIPFAIKGLNVTGGVISADFDPNEKSTQFIIQPKINKEKLEKSSGGKITFILTHPKCKKISIPFKRISRFKLQPSSSIIVFNADPKKPTKREVWILDNHKKGFEIESISSKKGYIKVLKQIKMDDRYKVKLELEITPPPKKQKAFSDTLEIKIKGGETLVINCRGFYPKKSRRRPKQPQEASTKK